MFSEQIWAQLFGVFGTYKLWNLCKKFPTAKTYCFAVNILTKQLSFKCKLCKSMAEDRSLHLIMFCPSNENIRSKLWSNVIVHAGLKSFICVRRQSPQNQILSLAGLKHFDSTVNTNRVLLSGKSISYYDNKWLLLIENVNARQLAYVSIYYRIWKQTVICSFICIVSSLH